MRESNFKQMELRDIPENWNVKKIGDIGNVIGGGTPSTKEESYYNGAIPWITPKDLSNYSSVFIEKGERNITKEGLENSSARLMPAGTVLFSSRAPIGYVAIAKNEVSTNQGFKSIVCNENFANNIFVYYSLKYNAKKIESISSGSVFKEVSGTALKNFKIIVPTLEEQDRIANILYSLDQKIDLNRQMNNTLEQIAQALFKRWFIDFEFPNENGDPYRSRGGRMVDSKWGEIPEGWKPSSVSAEFNITMGQSPPGDTYNENGEGEPFFQVRRDFGWRYPENRVYCTQPNRMAKKGDTLLSVRAPVGDINKATSDCCIGRGLAALRHKSGCEAYTYYSLMDLRRNFNNFDSEGIVFGSINQKDLKALKVLRPSSSIVEVFTHVVGVIDQQILNFDIQNRTLSQLRDSLLPKLMSGKIRVGY